MLARYSCLIFHKNCKCFSPTLCGCSLLEILTIFNTLIYYCYSEWAINLLPHWSPNVVVTDNNPRPYPLLLIISKKEARTAAHHGEGGGGKVLVSPL